MNDRAYKIAIHDGYQKGLASVVYNFFDKKTGSGAKASFNEELVQELHKPVNEIFKRRRVYKIFDQQI